MISIARPLDDASPTEAGRQWAELFELLARCERLLRDEFAQRTGPHGLTEAQFSLLWACRQAPPGGLSQNELAQSLTSSPAHVSGQVEQLRAKGLLAGHRRAPDRRRQVWQLTEQGHRQFETLLEELIGWFGQLEAQLPPPRRADLAELLRMLAASLDANRAASASTATEPQSGREPQRRGVSA